ncbi:MAG TPA: exodeoxyribonuclease VII small subunit [Bacteroidota bacterium]|nr:exodeoxyribonuclease VII small subunit [Bacteroidota bacterium]
MSASKKEPPKQTFEQSLQRLEEIVDHLEQGDVSLDESIKMYEEGLALSKACMDKLTQAEVKLKKLSKDIEGNFQLIDDQPE